MKSLLPGLLAAAAAILLVTGSAPGQDKPVLTIYTYDSFTPEWGPGPKVKAAFEAQCDCRVKFVALADGAALLGRLRLEGRNTRCDIVLGLDTNLLAEAKDTDLLAGHGLDLSTLKLALPWDDEVFLPYDYGHFAVVYDTETIKEPPSSLRGLVAGDPDTKLIIQDPRTSTPGLGLLLWVKAVYGDDATQAWEKLARRVLTVTKGWSEAYGLFLKGEAPMVLSYTTSPAYHMVMENTARYQAAAFEEGHYQQVEVAARLKTSQQPDLARRFLAFMVSPGFQDIIPTTNWMFPAGAVKTQLPDAFSRLVQPARSLRLPSEEVARHRKAWIDEWLRAMSK